MIAQTLQTWPSEGEYLAISAEEILQKILLHANQIKESDVEDYLNRPQQMIQNMMMIQASPMGGKGAACAHYLEQLEAANSAFKIIADNALLKAWEYTLASFAETKANFARWNLYSSLGLGPKEPGGIGKQLFETIQHKLDICNNKVQAIQSEYEQLFVQVKYLESRIKNASEKEAQWLKIEYQSKKSEFYALEELRDRTSSKARSIAASFEVLIDLYDSLFPQYFQEIYDADMQGIEQGQYDDSPAGFRLLYKHGRSNTSLWTLIQNANEFIQALVSFFPATENEIAADNRLSAIRDELGEIVTQVITHVRSQEFIETAFDRMAAAHHTRKIEKPLEHLEKIEKSLGRILQEAQWPPSSATISAANRNPPKLSAGLKMNRNCLFFCRHAQNDAS